MTPIAALTFLVDVVAAIVALTAAHGAWRNEAHWQTQNIAIASAAFICALIWLSVRPFAGLMAGGF